MAEVVVVEDVKDGVRQVTVRFDGLVVMPYVRQTRKTRWRADSLGRRAQQYNAMVAGLRDVLVISRNLAGVEPFGDVRLGFSGLFWVERRVNVMDLDNLLKATWDIARGVLFPDDRQVFVIDHAEKNRGRPAMVWKFRELGG